MGLLIQRGSIGKKMDFFMDRPGDTVGTYGYCSL